jgi:RepB DNA-primase from phage plasmid
MNSMDRAEISVRNMLTAVEAPLYDIGVLSDRGMLPGLDSIPAAAVLDRLSLLKYRNARGSHIYVRPSGEHRFTVLDDLNEATLARLSSDGFSPCAVVETSAGNFQAWLKHPAMFPRLIGTFAAQTLAGRYDADPSAADWRRFGRLPGFTNCKPKYRKPDGLFPFVRLKSHSGEQYPMAEVFMQEITKLYEEREQEREERRIQASLSPQRGRRLSNLSLERFRTSTKYQDRPAAADIAFCVAAYANGMTEDRIERALEDDYLSRDPSTSKRAAYIRRTMEKARRWAER